MVGHPSVRRDGAWQRTHGLHSRRIACRDDTMFSSQTCSPEGWSPSMPSPQRAHVCRVHVWQTSRCVCMGWVVRNPGQSRSVHRVKRVRADGRALRVRASRTPLYCGMRSIRPFRMSRASVCISITSRRSVRICDASGVLSAMSVSSTRWRCSRRMRR